MSESDSIIVETGFSPAGNIPQVSLSYGPNGKVPGRAHVNTAEALIFEAETVITPEATAEEQVIDEIIKSSVVGNDLLSSWLQEDTTVARSVIGMVRSIREAAKETNAEITDPQIFEIYYETWQQSLRDKETAKLANPAVEVDVRENEALAEQTLFIGSLLVDPMNQDSKLPF
jgi:hypothetical protein